MEYKSHLVALGCQKEHSIDYDEAFSPIAEMATIEWF